MSDQSPPRSVFRRLRQVCLAAAVTLTPVAVGHAQDAEPKAKKEADPAVAIVGTHVIRESDVQRAIQALTLGDQIDVRTRRARFIDSLVREELLFQFTLDEMQRDRQFRERLKSLLVGEMIEQRIRSKTLTTEEQARKYYDETKENLGGEHIFLREIQFQNEAVCTDQINKISTLEDFQKVAEAHHVIGELADSRGDVGTVMTRHIMFGYGDKLAGLAEHTVHKVMHEGKCHAVWIAEREVLPVPGFDELKDRLLAGLQAGAEAELLRSIIANANQRIGITRFEKTEAEEAAAEELQSAANVSRVPDQSAATDRQIASVKPETNEDETGGSPPEQDPSQASLPPVPAPGTFSLSDQNGKIVSQADLTGRPVVMTFGFTHCPEICPTTLAEMTAWIDMLQKQAGEASWVFVSVDPERDTPEVLKSYMSYFSDRIVGLTGAPEQIASLAVEYDVFIRRVPLDDGDYTMDHTSSVFLIDADGKVAGTIPYGTSIDRAADKIAKFISQVTTKVSKSD